MSSHKYSIQEGKELRIQYYEDESFKISVALFVMIDVQVHIGQCEINGCELSGTQEFVNRNVSYLQKERNAQFAVYAWFNTTVSIEGRVKNAYVAEDSKTPLYFDIHRQVYSFIIIISNSSNKKEKK